METVAKLAFAEIVEGQSFSFDTTFSEKMIDAFSVLTGDISPLHMDRDFARQRGFHDRVVHGALLGGLVSRLVGVHLPGRNCLLHGMTMKYHSPVYAGDTVRVTGTVEQVSIAAKAMTIQVAILNIASQLIVAKGKATVGFTENKSR